MPAFNLKEAAWIVEIGSWICCKGNDIEILIKNRNSLSNNRREIEIYFVIAIKIEIKIVKICELNKNGEVETIWKVWIIYLENVRKFRKTKINVKKKTKSKRGLFLNIDQ